MSKKKFSAGSMTMTLKDFHGGSIPSELLLPSAPGISSRPQDRPSARIAVPNTAGAATGARADHQRPRPGSSGGLPRVLDEGGPAFLSSPSFIGRHFDEDERKPFDSSSAPRRPSAVAAESTRTQPVVVSQTVAISDSKRPGSSPVVAHHLSPSAGVSTSSAGNAWAARKEALVKGAVVSEPPLARPSVTLSGPAAASRFAQASAIEKVSSGRWQSKPTDVEMIRFQNVENLDRWTVDSPPSIWNDEEGNLVRISSYTGVKEGKLGGLHSDGFLQQARVISSPYPEIKDANTFEFQSDLSHPVSHEFKVAASQHQHTLDDASERPKLKLLPRTKPLEPSDLKLLEDKQGYLHATSLMHAEEPQEMRRTVGKIKSESVGADSVSRPVERPKLNLKPRTQPIEQHDEISEKERKTVFGGARPREFVLKERAVDAVDNLEIGVQSHRAKSDDLKIESKLEPAASSFNRHVEGVESSPRNNAERKDNQPYQEKGICQRNSRRNENWRNLREMEKKPVERLEEHETWRKPIEPPKPETPPGPRVMRAASALELAQAFSKSMSDSRVDNRYTNQRMLPGPTQIPFSRLTDTREIYSGSAQRHINGY
ncbi:LOW QUALITY PROTEIN: uncharacterized protein LOC110030118 [Phalaenopsis equestris]|uniref:LOW QUALITY PROTEIN: uncharacterized protein LOC110030118 n=1 Tax=Phalaenopsis equestris TaxID=78828 RepID=UPI0009E3A683|nr:LOW QUALITY PROTEIN: uncharacterized protein LOC110030118 [Phalaenopsis equestris]